MKKNQERRLHRKNAKIVKEGGTPMTLSRPIKPDTTVSCFSLLLPFFCSCVLGSCEDTRCAGLYGLAFTSASAVSDRPLRINPFFPPSCIRDTRC